MAVLKHGKPISSSTVVTLLYLGTQTKLSCICDNKIKTYPCYTTVFWNTKQSFHAFVITRSKLIHAMLTVLRP